MPKIWILSIYELYSTIAAAAHGFIVDFGRFWKRKKKARKSALAKIKTIRCDWAEPIFQNPSWTRNNTHIKYCSNSA